MRCLTRSRRFGVYLTTSLRPSSDVPGVFIPQATRAATRQDFVEIARAKERGQHHRLRPSPPSCDSEHHTEHHASEAISCYNITPIQMASGQRSQWSQNTHRHSILGHSSSAERRERGREGESTQSSLQRVTVDADRWRGHALEVLCIQAHSDAFTHTRIQGECRPPKGLAQLQDACMLTRVGGAIGGHRSLSVEALDQRALIKTAVVRAVARAVARAASHLRFIRPKIHKIPSIVLKDPLFGIPCRCEE